MVKRHSMENPTEVDLHDGEDGGIVMDIHHRRRSRGSGDFGPLISNSNLKPHERIALAIETLERERNNKLRERHVIGHVTSMKLEPDYHINARKVNFRWQRGTKIGEGQFGKVYSAVNMDSGELMAMKEMKFQANDHQALKEIADEIILFEGIQHENLVKYHGVEIHKDEMLVFMEYCDRGTLEEAAKMGLPEPMIRMYTKEILIAVNFLHDNNIVHRDIKGANIFLTSSGCLKLGDFGCSAKLKSHTTMPGEFNNLVGTTAYMAPEVITKNDQEGHGRAADIWSLGCVVVEMGSGKRPWFEFENNYQIMFRVGMGGTPTIPDNLSAEGKDFISHCFKHDPSTRKTASELLDHSFVKVQIEDQEG
uniref:Mitogen-activated protein kinase kinase kinase 4 n=1 Tax=Tegillarca granosa TaxID=220873 RepID=A0A1X9RHQ4_TEGGR|nr:mitogen-activated protein kinase kinase kinase 4 [Tegillarca granosa]